MEQSAGDRTAPKSVLRIEWIYGYRAAGCRSNIHVTASGEIVYFSAGVGIVENINEHKQKFFLGHDNDIISSALHHERVIIATGQIGKNAQICVWNTSAMKLESLLQGHKDGVGALNFHPDGEKIASVGIDSDNVIKIWNWRKGKMLATVIGHQERVLDIMQTQDQLITCGVKHIRFWTLLGNTLQYKDGSFGKFDVQTLLCIGHFSVPKTCFTGAINGDIYIWKDGKVDRFIAAAHSSSIYSIAMTANGFLSSGKDGLVKIWNDDFTPVGPSVKIPCFVQDSEEATVCSIACNDSFVIAGTRQSEIYSFNIQSNTAPKLVVAGHSDDGLWALACHPRENVFATGGDDGALRFWNADQMHIISFYFVPFSQSSATPSIRSCGYSSNGNNIAVGFDNGLVEIYPTSVTSQQDPHVKPIHIIQDRTERIQTVKFSPNDQYLAVSCSDGNIDIYVVKDKYKSLQFKYDNHGTAIYNIDWTEDEKYIQAAGEIKERYVFEISCKYIKVTERNVANIKNWHTYNSLKQDDVKGIWNKFAEKTDIVTIDADIHLGVIAGGDENGLIKLFRFPAERR
ncbi:unnamed protein product, partial [Didymodactylos carnosus]